MDNFFRSIGRLWDKIPAVEDPNVFFVLLVVGTGLALTFQGPALVAVGVGTPILWGVLRVRDKDAAAAAGGPPGSGDDNVTKFFNPMEYQDWAQTYQLNFQDPATPIMEGIVDLHHNLMTSLIIVFFMVLYLFSFLLYHFWFLWTHATELSMDLYKRYYFLLTSLHHGTVLELVWTLTPALILLLIAVPSFSLLYSMDEVIDPVITIKVIGHQWYWSYEMKESGIDFSFDSYMVPFTELVPGDLRLLEVDNVLCVPSRSHIRFLITSADVLHSFAVPSLGIKVDAVPGRLNQISCYLQRNGYFYGQCSELCGVNHGFMPISLRAVDPEIFLRHHQ